MTDSKPAPLTRCDHPDRGHAPACLDCTLARLRVRAAPTAVQHLLSASASIERAALVVAGWEPVADDRWRLGALTVAVPRWMAFAEAVRPPVRDDLVDLRETHLDVAARALAAAGWSRYPQCRWHDPEQPAALPLATAEALLVLAGREAQS